MSYLAWRETAVTPGDEDRAMFHNTPSQRQVFLIPRHREAAQDEYVIHGFLPGNVAVEVVFAGRRKALALPLIDRLNKLAEGVRDADDAATPGHAARLPAAIYGSLRSRFVQDEDGWQTRRFQLIAAIWRIRDPSGRFITRGSAPVLGHRRHLRPL